MTISETGKRRLSTKERRIARAGQLVGYLMIGVSLGRWSEGRLSLEAACSVVVFGTVLILVLGYLFPRF